MRVIGQASSKRMFQILLAIMYRSLIPCSSQVHSILAVHENGTSFLSNKLLQWITNNLCFQAYILSISNIEPDGSDSIP